MFTLMVDWFRRYHVVVHLSWQIKYSTDKNKIFQWDGIIVKEHVVLLNT